MIRGKEGRALALVAMAVSLLHILLVMLGAFTVIMTVSTV